MSKIRTNVPETEGDLPFDENEPCPMWEVFMQAKPGVRHVHAGTITAPDRELAMQYAREHYGQDEPCVSMWIAPRDAILVAGGRDEIIWRTTDQSYRLARGYSREVRRKWEAIRSKEDVDTYQSEDLKETF